MEKITLCVVGASLLGFHSLAFGQGEYSVLARGPHHRVWGRITAQANGTGEIHYQTNSFKELATGLCVWNSAARQWSDASDAFELTADGFAVAQHAQHQVIVAPSVIHPEGVLDCQMPDGRRFRVAVLALNVYSPVTGQSLQIATVKDCAGVQVAPNEILFDDIFDGMLRGGLRIRNLLGELHHDVLLAERFSAAQLEKLAALGFDSRMRLEVWTEVLESPSPAIETALVQTLAEQAPGTLASPDIYDSSVSFGSMSLLPGSTFVEGADDSARVPVYKQWYTDDPSGRVVLLEGAGYSDVEPLMQALPESTMTVFNERTSSGRLLSNWRRATSTNTEVRMARAELPASEKGPRVVWDFNLGNTTLTNFTGKADETIYVSGNARIAGTLVLEGNCVLKFTNSLASVIASNLVLKTGPYSPVVLTAKDNDNVGATISGSSGTPTGWYGFTGLDLAGALTNPVLSHVRFSYLKNALKGPSMTVRDCQFIRCGNVFGAGSSYAELKLQNVLLHRIENVVYVNPNGWALKGEHVTAHSCTNFMQMSSVGTVFLTNSLFVCVTNWHTASTYTNTTAVLHADTGVFNTAGAGSHYLAEFSPYRNAGTTNITAALLTALEQRTTFAPVLYSSTNFANQGIIFYPRAPRDSDLQPDLGYHYAPLDYLASQVLVTNSTLTVTPGTVLGVLAQETDSYGMALGTGARFSCIGSPTSRNWVVAYNTVQELSDSGWSQPDLGGLVDVPGQSLQSLACRFTSWSVMDQMARHVSADSDQAFGFEHCEFRSGRVWANPPSLSFTNCLFERVLVHLFPEDLRQLWVRNCLFLGGVFAFSPSVTNAVAKDNLFDGAEVPDYITGSVGTYHGDFNAYVTNDVPANFRLKPFCATDILLASSPQYQVGTLGNYYLLTGSGLLDADTKTSVEMCWTSS